ncbi:MAG: hypothetical protein FWG64_00625 [Firmicutes bacterium]|nr:hypothetical protein [Bacillota bacterium]
MEHKDFAKLTKQQQNTLLIALHVRNSLEDFHVKNLSDAQMKELNQITRQAIYEGLGFVNEKDNKNDLWQLTEKLTKKYKFEELDESQIAEITQAEFNEIKDNHKIKRKDIKNVRMINFLIEEMPHYWEIPPYPKNKAKKGEK